MSFTTLHNHADTDFAVTFGGREKLKMAVAQITRTSQFSTMRSWRVMKRTLLIMLQKEEV